MSSFRPLRDRVLPGTAPSNWPPEQVVTRLSTVGIVGFDRRCGARRNFETGEKLMTTRFVLLAFLIGSVAVSIPAQTSSEFEFRQFVQAKNATTNRLRMSEPRLTIDTLDEANFLLAIARELDYPTTRKTVSDGVRRFPQTASSVNVTALLTTFPDRFRQSTGANAVAEARRHLGMARSAGNRIKAGDHADLAVALADVVLAVLPDDPGALEVRRDASAILGKPAAGGGAAAGAVDSNLATKIVFYRKPAGAGSADASTASASFTAGEPVYGVAYLRGPVRELVDIPNQDYVGKMVKYRIFVDGQEHLDFKGYPAYLTWDEYQDPNRTRLAVDLAPLPEAVDYPRARLYDNAIKFTKLLADSPPGRHEIEVHLMAGERLAAKGSFVLDTTSGASSLADRSTALHRERISKVRLPQPKMSNPGLQSAMASALKANGWHQQVLRVVITSAQWTIHRNAFGVIMFRSVNTTVALKEQDGRCRLFEISFKQPYRGGGYGAAEQHGVGDNDDIACENVR